MEKENIIADITKRINQICTTDFLSCTIPACRFYNRCCKNELLQPRKSLKSYRRYKKQIEKYYHEFKGRKSATYQPNTLIGRCNYWLGENIFEHELVKDSDVAKYRISKARTMGQVVQILDDMHLLKYGKRKNLRY